MGLIYTVLIIALSTSLIGWQLWGQKKDFSVGMILTYAFMIAYFAFMVQSDASLWIKGVFIAKDLLLIATFSLFARIGHRATLLKLPIFLFLTVALFYMVKWTSVITPFLPNEVKDDRYELIIEAQKPFDTEFVTFLDKNKMTVSPAYNIQDGSITNLDDYYVLNVPNNKFDQLAKYTQAISTLPGVAHVEFNEIITLDDPTSSFTQIPRTKGISLNDPLNVDQWGLHQLVDDDFFKKIENIKPAQRPLLVILDTGVDANHEDLNDNFLSIEEKSDNDPVGHGTHCAGIAGAISNNGIGISSLNSNHLYDISSVKVLNSFGSGTQRTIINGMIKAADAGADVISMSLGGRSNDKLQKAYDDAVKYVNQKGGIVVVAAGNSATNSINYSPANSKGVICVAATDENQNLAKFSNFTDEIEMGVAAPGVNIMSSIPGNQYRQMNGTSMATPYVASIVAIIKAVKPNADTDEVFRILDLQTSGQAGVKIIDPRSILDQLEL